MLQAEAVRPWPVASRVRIVFISALFVLLAGCPLSSPRERGPLDKSAYQLYREEAELERRTRALTHFSYAQALVLDGRGDQAVDELLSALKADPDSAYLREVLAYVLYREGRPEEALAWARDAVKYGPERPQAHYLVGAILVEQQDFSGGEAALQKAHELAPDDPDYVIGLADARLRQGKVEEALAALEGFAEKHPDQLLVRYYAGVIYMHEGEGERAGRVFRSILKRRPSFYPALHDLFLLERERGNLEAAIQTGRALVEFYPEDAASRLNLADLLLKTGRDDEALRVLETGKSQGELMAAWWVEKGYIYLRQENHAAAREEFELALALDAGSVEAIYGLGLVELAEGNELAAASLLETVPRDSRFYVQARRQLAVIAFRQDRPDHAVMIMERVYHQDPLSLLATLFYSWALRDAGEHDRAQEVVEPIFRLHPDREELLLELALIYVLKGESDLAIALMEEFLKTHPESAMALNFVGYTLADEGRELDRAESLIRSALALEPDAGYIMDSLGWVYYQRGQYAESLAWLEKALSAAGPDSEILEHLGDCHLALGRRVKARESYQQALERATSVEQRKRLRDKLKEL